MDNISQWATVICIAAVVCVLFELLSPKGSMEKMLRFVLGLFMLCAIILPITQGAFTFHFDFSPQESFEQKSDFEQQTEEQIKELGKESVSTLTQQCMNKMNVEAKKIEISMDTKQDNSISIVMVTVTIDPKDKDQKIKIRDTLKKELGLEVQVITEGG